MCVPKRNFGTEKEFCNRRTENFPDENVFTADGKGICRSSWRKWMRYPRRLRVPSLNKIAQAAVRPSPLWEFRAANCFRDFIVASQNENPRWSGLCTWTGSPALGAASAKDSMLVSFAPLGCKRIRSASRRWWSFQNLWWSQVLTSVPNQISHPQLSFRYDKCLSLRNEYDILFEMRICTCVIKPFGSLQVVIRFSEWQAAGSRIRQA